MKPVIKLRHGDLFNGSSDLIVLPCATGGSVTEYVARSLQSHSIPVPRRGMRLGEVDIRPFSGGENIAQYVAFAASVEFGESSPDAIDAIGRKLGEFTRTQSSVRKIAVPLLGAGAGGLRSEVVLAVLKKGFIASAADDASMVVHVLHRQVFNRLIANSQLVSERRARSLPNGEAVRVFISHTSKTNEAAAWVKELANYLIGKGIQARLDLLHLRHGMDLPQWMCNELSMAHKVIVVCDEAYKAKADRRLGGVGWETMIIMGDLLDLPPESTKYQIVVRCEKFDEGMPLYLKTRYAFHAPSGNRAFRSELFQALRDAPIDASMGEEQPVV